MIRTDDDQGNDKFATLYVSDRSMPNWVPTVGTDKREYWYLFEGGEGGGVFRGKKNEGAVEFVVKLDAGQDYDMQDVTFERSGDQLTYDQKKSNKKRVVIQDANTQAMEGYYSVIVARRDGVQIPCDPMIKNDPRQF
jgi:hypothetical protein